MVLSQKERYETISTAMKMIDPDCMLTAGSHEHDIILSHITSLLEEVGPEETLKQIEGSKAHLQSQVYQMVM